MNVSDTEKACESGNGWRADVETVVRELAAPAGLRQGQLLVIGVSHERGAGPADRHVGHDGGGAKRSTQASRRCGAKSGFIRCFNAASI